MMARIDLVKPGGQDITPVGPFPTGQSIPPPGTPKFKPLPSRPYVFTHLYPPITRGAAAGVAVGRRVEIQLPGDPTLWAPEIEGDSVRRRSEGDAIYPSREDGPYDGVHHIFSFGLQVVEPGCSTITLPGAPPPLPWLANPQVFTLAAAEGEITGQAGECPAP